MHLESCRRLTILEFCYTTHNYEIMIKVRLLSTMSFMSLQCTNKLQIINIVLFRLNYLIRIFEISFCLEPRNNCQIILKNMQMRYSKYFILSKFRNLAGSKSQTDYIGKILLSRNISTLLSCIGFQ